GTTLAINPAAASVASAAANTRPSFGSTWNRKIFTLALKYDAPAPPMTSPAAIRIPALLSTIASTVRGRGAERHAHADLVRALRDYVGHDAVDAGGGNHQTQDAEQRE